jgi:hypothetical protein
MTRLKKRGKAANQRKVAKVKPLTIGKPDAKKSRKK